MDHCRRSRTWPLGNVFFLSLFLLLLLPLLAGFLLYTGGRVVTGKSPCTLAGELVFLFHNMGVRTHRLAKTYSLCFICRAVVFLSAQGFFSRCRCQRGRLCLEAAGASFVGRQPSFCAFCPLSGVTSPQY